MSAGLGSSLRGMDRWGLDEEKECRTPCFVRARCPAPSGLQQWVFVHLEQAFPAPVNFLLDLLGDWRELVRGQVGKGCAHAGEEVLYGNLLSGFLRVIVQFSGALLDLVEREQTTLHGLVHNAEARLRVRAPIERADREEAPENEIPLADHLLRLAGLG